MRWLETLLAATVAGTLSAHGSERPLGPGARALAVQPAGGERVGGLQPIQPGHCVYLHTDDRPGVSSTFNSGVIVTSDGVFVVDALGSDAIARQTRDAIVEVTDQPVRFLVSSTYHGPFTGGNAV